MTTICSISTRLKDASVIGVMDRDKIVEESIRAGGLFYLPLEVFHLKHHIWSDGAFVIEHGVGEGCFRDSAYFSGDAEGEFVDCFDGAVIT